MNTPPGDTPRGHRRDIPWLILIVYSALLLRGYLPYQNVFGSGRTVFQGHDAWYHARLIEHLVHNFPYRLGFDPYAVFPGGQEVRVPPFFDYAVALVAWILGLGAPSAELTEKVIAWAPAVLGALCAIPVYFLGRRALDRRVGLLAAGLLIVLPGQFLIRSLLGFSDHHVTEVFLSTLAAWLFLRAADLAHAGGARPWAVARRAVLAGIALGAYQLSWGGGAMFVAVLVLWLAVQQMLDHFAGRPAAGLGWVAAPAAVAAFAVLLPWWQVMSRPAVHGVALGILAVVPVALDVLAARLARTTLSRSLLLIAPVVLAVAGWGGLHLTQPELAAKVAAQLGRFTPSSSATTVGEATPLLLQGEGGWAAIWEQYRLAFVMGLVGLGVLVIRIVRRGARPGLTLLLVWGLAMYAATLAQNRFGYYLDVQLALLFGLLCSTILAPARRAREQRPSIPRALAAAAIALAAFLPSVKPTLQVARVQIGPHEGWLTALDWMRQNTPEPLGDPASYFGKFVRTEARGDEPVSGDQPVSFAYPPSAYGVMTWWDYGYWIARLGRRFPTANPTQLGAATAARFYLATEEEDAVRILDEVGARYAVVNFDLGLWRHPDTGDAYGIFEALVVWAGEDTSRYWDIVWEPGPNGERYESTVFYPAFYRTMAMRLSLAGGGTLVAADATWAIALVERVRADGVRIKETQAAQQFPTYKAAVAFVDARPESEDWRIVGRDPQFPCVPLPAVRHLGQVFPESDPGAGPQPVRIFERLSTDTNVAKSVNTSAFAR